MKETRRSPLDPYEFQNPSPALQTRMEMMASIDGTVREYVNQSKEIYEKIKLLNEEMREEIRSMDSELAELHELEERVRTLERVRNTESENDGTLEEIKELLDDMRATLVQQNRLFTTIMQDLQLEWNFQQKKQAVIQDTLMKMRHLQAKHSNAVESYPDNLLYPDQRAKNN